MLGEVTFTKNDLGKVLCLVDGEPLTHDVENFEGNFTFNSQGFNGLNPLDESLHKLYAQLLLVSQSLQKSIIVPEDSPELKVVHAVFDVVQQQVSLFQEVPVPVGVAKFTQDSSTQTFTGLKQRVLRNSLHTYFQQRFSQDEFVQQCTELLVSLVRELMFFGVFLQQQMLADHKESQQVKQPVLQGSGKTYSKFGSVTYSETFRSILVVKSVGTPLYLVSFMLGFYDYLVNTRHKRIKLVFIVPPGERYAYKYGEPVLDKSSFIDDINYTNKGAYNQDILFINYPTYKVIHNLFIQKFDSLVIVDMRGDTYESIVTGRNKCVNTVFAASSFKELQHAQQVSPACRRAFALGVPLPRNSTMFTVEPYENFPEVPKDRVGFYRDYFEDKFRTLEGFLPKV